MGDMNSLLKTAIDETMQIREGAVFEAMAKRLAGWLYDTTLVISRCGCHLCLTITMFFTSMVLMFFLTSSLSSISQDVSNDHTFVTWCHVKIVTPPMIGVYSFAPHCFDFNGPFMQVFYFSFLIAEATSPLFLLW